MLPWSAIYRPPCMRSSSGILAHSWSAEFQVCCLSRESFLCCLVTLVPEIRLKAPTERTKGKWRKHRDFTALLISWIFVFPLEAGRARKNDHVQNWEQHKVHRFLEMRCFEMLPSKVLRVACIRISTKNVFSFSSRFNCNFAVSEGPTIMHVGTHNTTLKSGMTVPVTSGTQHHSHPI